MKKIRLKEISEVLSEDELKNVVGGSTASEACRGKSSGDSCVSGGSSGYCRYMPFSGLICWR